MGLSDSPQDSRAVVMFQCSMLTLLAVLPFAESQKEEDELKKLQGTWRVVKAFVDGERDSEGEGKEFSIVNNEVVWPRLENGKQSRFALTIDSTKEPKRMDWKFVGPDGVIHLWERGIFQLNGDRLKVCFTGSGQRPAEMKSQKGDRRTLAILERVVKK